MQQQLIQATAFTEIILNFSAPASQISSHVINDKKFHVTFKKNVNKKQCKKKKNRCEFLLFTREIDYGTDLGLTVSGG